LETNRLRISLAGITVGGAALLLALVHFWAGPFAPTQSVEQTVAETAVAIRDATVAALKGEESSISSSTRKYDVDDWLLIATAILGGIAVILGVVAYAKGEPLRAAGGAAVLGASAIAFQFAVVALAIIVLAILISAVIGGLGIG